MSAMYAVPYYSKSKVTAFHAVSFRHMTNLTTGRPMHNDAYNRG